MYLFSPDAVCARKDPPKDARLRNRLTPTVLAVALLSAGGCDGGKTHDLWNDAFHCHSDSNSGGDTSVVPPIPPANASSESLVQASGDALTGPGGVIENSAIIGEPIEAGVQSSAGAASVRHGFAPPIPPGWPSGIAQVEPAAPSTPHRD